MRILVLGFYGHSNLGDDMFRDAIEKLLPNEELVFRELILIKKEEVTNYPVVLVGGGDLINDFYGQKLLELFPPYSSNFVCGLGLGVSFHECRTRNYLQVFDHLFLRNRADIWPINTILGSASVSTMPDLGFSFPLERPLQVKNGKKFVLLLVGTIMKTPSFLFCLCTFLERLLAWGFRLECIPMYTEEKESITNDKNLNDYLEQTFSYTKQVISHPPMTLDEFYDKLSYFDYGICMRFHGHVFCTRSNIPFLSIPLTRKCSLYLDELPTPCRYEIPLVRNEKYQVQNFDRKRACELTKQLIAEGETVSSLLSQYNKEQEKIYQLGLRDKIATLLYRKKKRTTHSLYYRSLKLDDIYQETLDDICSRGINPFLDTDFSPEQKQELAKVAASLCYRLTNDTSNSYLFGTISNLQNNLNKLRDIIAYIISDLGQKTDYPPINLDYINQHSFRGLHRAGWQFAIDGLVAFSGNHGILCDTYCDRTFHWASSLLSETGILPYTNYWIGFIHHTFETEFAKDNNCDILFKSPLFLASLPVCRGIFALSEYLAQQIKERLEQVNHGHVPVNVLTHPTIFPHGDHFSFSWNNLRANPQPRLISIGSWYREPTAIFRISFSEFIECKCLDGSVLNFRISALKGKKMDANFCPPHLKLRLVDNGKQLQFSSNDNIWSNYFAKWLNGPVEPEFQEWAQEFITTCQRISRETKSEIIEVMAQEELSTIFQRWYSQVDIVDTLSNEEYDSLTTTNVVFLYLVDASVANTIIECIVRNTPIIINRSLPTEEFLGENYPLFYNSIDEVASLLTEENIKAASEHIHGLGMQKENYRIENFLASFHNSDIMKTIIQEQRKNF